MGQKCCSSAPEEPESQKENLKTEQSNQENQMKRLNLRELNYSHHSGFFEEEEEEEEDQFDFLYPQETIRSNFRTEDQPEKYLLNYKGKRITPQKYEDFKLEEVEERFPKLSDFVKKAIETAKDHLEKMSRKIDYDKVYKLSYKGDTRVCWFQGNKKSIKGSGYCRILNPNGEYFEGLIKNFELLKGLICLENEEFYFSNFQNNCLSGKVEQFCSNGDYFKGMMKDGKRSGKGKIKWSDGSYYEGNFKNDQIHGEGKYTYSNGDFYDGYFVNGIKQGKGIYNWSNGDIYDGEWVQNYKEGYGVFKWADGSVYKGYWKNDMREGKGSFTNMEEKTREGLWIKDLLHGKVIVNKGEDYELWKYGREIDETKEIAI